MSSGPLHLRGTLLPGREIRDVFVVDGRITFHAQADALTLADGAWIAPGLVDCHAHLSLMSPAPADANPRERAMASAKAHLDAGVLAVREPGSPDLAAHGLGPADGLPRVITGGHFLAPEGRYFDGLYRPVAAADLPDVAETEARSSGGWTKVIGDWFESQGATLNYPVEVMTEAASRVHAAGCRIAIHASGAVSVEAAIEAGFDSIEHGHGLREEHLPEMVRRGIALVPTMTISDGVREIVPSLGMDAPALTAALAAIELHPAMVGKAAAAGVLVLAGTDAGMVPHGLIAREVRNLMGAGLTPEAALGAASWSAREYLGLAGLEEGAPADLVAYRDDPRGYPELLSQPLVTVLGGRVVSSGVRATPAFS